MIDRLFRLNKILNENFKESFQEMAYSIYNLKGLSAMQAYNQTIGALEKLAKKLKIKYPTMENAKWTFWGSILYAFTIYTTIGKRNSNQLII